MSEEHPLYTNPVKVNRISKVVFGVKSLIFIEIRFYISDINYYSNEIEVQDYLAWYKGVMKKIDLIRSKNFSYILKFSIEVILTKYWTSYLSLCGFAGLTIFVYGVIFLKSNEQLSNLNSYFDAIYFSMSNFTKMGNCDIFPLTDMMKLFAISESIIGYLFLAVLIYLLSKKLNYKY